MALTEETVVDRIEVIEIGCLQVRTATVIKRDGVELNRSFHRHVLAPGDSLDGQDARVSAIATATWTDEVIANYQASLSEATPPFPTVEEETTEENAG